MAHLLSFDPRPDVLLVTGDVADHGLPDEYAEARTLLDAEPYPLIWQVGPPTVAFHLLHHDGRLTTHWRALPFPGDV
jgi:3',5'-cyclic AMP phosphodiesterase CpdA